MTRYGIVRKELATYSCNSIYVLEDTLSFECWLNIVSSNNWNKHFQYDGDEKYSAANQNWKKKHEENKIVQNILWEQFQCDIINLKNNKIKKVRKLCSFKTIISKAQVNL